MSHSKFNGRKKTEAVGDMLMLQKYAAFWANEPKGSRDSQAAQHKYKGAAWRGMLRRVTASIHGKRLEWTQEDGSSRR
jgi:hypothetical protein